MIRVVLGVLWISSVRISLLFEPGSGCSRSGSAFAVSSLFLRLPFAVHIYRHSHMKQNPQERREIVLKEIFGISVQYN